ncbi:uncharacterized protein LOC128954913 isoform X2 [Oppia nitens]|uniref:uncharacterized protein LOC128954913 isoform X2 n=1 Tax=Oppia nitens TaxID=1686743 RepID=UPI0023DBA446|nr:uncharacterized protein LOC128954913 isoform X2 [Oppia nitens]
MTDSDFDCLSTMTTTTATTTTTTSTTALTDTVCHIVSECTVCGQQRPDDSSQSSCPPLQQQQLKSCCCLQSSNNKDINEIQDDHRNQINDFLNANHHNSNEFQIRHSKSDPVIHSSHNNYRFYIERSDIDSNSDLNTEINTTLLYPRWFSSSSSLSSMDSTISAEDFIHEMVTIEGLRTVYNSCFECGVSWHQNHVTLDCSECGGYAMSRPCPECDGKCDSQWQRNLRATHELRKAQWVGQCNQRLTTNELRDSSTKSSSHPQLISSLKV